MNCWRCGKPASRLDRYGLCPQCSPVPNDHFGWAWDEEEPEQSPELECVKV